MSESFEVLELKEKLADLLENSYARDQAMEEALNAKNLEISNLREALSRAPSDKMAFAKLHAELISRDATIADLTASLDSMRHQIQSDLKSISEYSIECPKCRNLEIPSPSHGHDELVRQREFTIETLEASLAAVKHEMHQMRSNAQAEAQRMALDFERRNAEQIQNAVAAAEQEISRISISLDAVVSERDELLDRNDSLSRELRAMSDGISKSQELVKTREEQLKLAEQHVHALQVKLESVRAAAPVHVAAADHILEQSALPESTESEIAALNAKRVAAALAQYCQQLTNQLRAFRKKEKRGKSVEESRSHPLRAPRSPVSKAVVSPVVVPQPAQGGWNDEPHWGGEAAGWGDSSVKSSGSQSAAKASPTGWSNETWAVAPPVTNKTPSPKAKDAEDDLFSMLN